MSKSYYSLGLMSGTSMDGIDASIIQSDGENKYKAIIDKYNRGVLQDPGLKQLHWSQGGKDYLKNDQKYFEDFLMSTAMNDKPGYFTGNNRKFS